MLVPKMAATSKSIAKADAYAHLVKKKGRHMTLKKKALSAKPKYNLNPNLAPKKWTTKDKKKLNKTLWDSTHDNIELSDNSDYADVSSDEEPDLEMQTTAKEEVKE